MTIEEKWDQIWDNCVDECFSLPPRVFEIHAFMCQARTLAESIGDVLIKIRIEGWAGGDQTVLEVTPQMINRFLTEMDEAEKQP